MANYNAYMLQSKVVIFECILQVFSCPACGNFYCLDCDLFVHEMLHSCPACSSERNEMSA